eukprot:TRINITY_DN27601_c0_g1_i2.p1 TRINITY_DN27601_c0_g1~~TRINITY_DN27601_c0_g1_i2.p1  ORF type:complete len:114 (+),score=36.55 TRINITY_DN27601_c0_g1_i2:135-476(+)
MCIRDRCNGVEPATAQPAAEEAARKGSYLSMRAGTEAQPVEQKAQDEVASTPEREGNPIAGIEDAATKAEEQRVWEEMCAEAEEQDSPHHQKVWDELCEEAGIEQEPAAYEQP